MLDQDPNSDGNEVQILLEKKPTAAADDEGGDPTSEDATTQPLRRTSAFDGTAVYRWLKTSYENARLPRRYRLVTEENVLQYSIQSVRFTVMCSAINTKMLNPNYPIMVQGSQPDAFPNTEPFDYNSATYFLPMCSLLGVAIASVFLGKISDRVGRKKVLLVLAWISVVGSIVKYFSRKTFWGFCIASFVFGFFLGNLPVAMAYVGDIFTSKKEKERELGILVSFFVMGNSGGGIIAILMYESGLFAPLWVGAGILAVAALLTSWYMVEAGDVVLNKVLASRHAQGEEEVDVRPETIDKKALWNIVAGAVADNFGSTGLFPLCLSPLAIEQYLFDFIYAEPPQEPIMTVTGYQWLSVMVAAMVIPSTMMTPFCFRKLGVAGTCVAGNLFTALVTLALLLIGNGPATNAMFGVFVFVMYAGFPFTVFSQLTTGPMLDVIAPIDKIGYVQGLNNAAMNFGMALAPWLFGLLADSTNTNTAVSVGIGISVLAAAINSPLTFDARFGRVKQLPSSRRVLSAEDPEFVEKALAGDLVDQGSLFLVNLDRMYKGKGTIIPRVKPYSEDKANGLQELCRHAGNVFDQRLKVTDQILVAINDPNNERTKEEICQMLNAALYSDEEMTNEATADLGRWIGDYLQDAGYNPHTLSTVIKRMVVTALPPISDGREYTPENLELSLLRSRYVFEKYSQVHHDFEKEDWNFSGSLGTSAIPVFYS